MHSEMEEIKGSKRIHCLNRETSEAKGHMGGGDERAQPRKGGKGKTERRGRS